MSASGDDGTHKRGGFTALLGGATSGRLVFTSGAAGITIQADPALRALARGRFTGALPGFQVNKGLVSVQTRRFPPLDLFSCAHGLTGEIGLNPTIPWEIEFRGGASRVTANLRGVQLRSFDVLGSASQILLGLSKPAGTTYILYLLGRRRQPGGDPAAGRSRVQVAGAGWGEPADL